MRTKKPIQYYEALLPKPQQELSPIPRLLHQIYIGASADTLAPEMKANIQHLQELNPQWSYRLWDEASIVSFIQEAYGKAVLGYYRMISPRYRAAQADFVRYLLVYHFGGVYLDIKSTYTRPLDEVLDLERDNYVIYHWDNEREGCYKGFGFFKDLPLDVFPYGEYHQGFIMGRPKHPILYAVIAETMRRLDAYNPFRIGVGLHGVLRTTGPIMYSQTIEAMKARLQPTDYTQLRCIEEIGGRISIYDDAGAFAHRKKISTYHNQLSAVSLNGSEKITRILYPAFLAWRVLRILGDKVRQRFGKSS